MDSESDQGYENEFPPQYVTIQAQEQTQTQPRPRPSLASQQNCFRFAGGSSGPVEISSNFDSGNLGRVTQLSDFSFRVAPSCDCAGTKFEGQTKSWFYFSAVGFPPRVTAKFTVTNVNILLAIYNSKDPNSYRPVCKRDGGPWQRLAGRCSLAQREEEIELHFQQQFGREDEKWFFALSYPFSYEQNLAYLQSLDRQMADSPFFYHRTTLVKTPEQRLVHLITVTEELEGEEPEELSCEHLFPCGNQPPAVRKPVIFVTARVHPGQSPSSFAMQGLVQFITSRDLRASLLRRMFCIKIVPMLNPDGVSHGHYRMDIFNQNLNRYYNSCSFSKQPAIYAVRKLIDYYSAEGQLSFYFDLHAHGSRKGNFIYGNALNDFVQQVESQVYCRLLALNCPNFELESCNFSKKHMKAKDKYEQLTKEGCGRVVVNKVSGIIHSFTLECGLVASNTINQVCEPANSSFRVGSYELLVSEDELSASGLYSGGAPLFTPEMYQGLGKAMLVAVLDTFDRNPYTRVASSPYLSMDNLRRITAFEVFHEEERFRMFEQFTYRKVKSINQLIDQQFLSQYGATKSFNLKLWPDLREVEWPPGLQLLAKYNAPRPPERVSQAALLEKADPADSKRRISSRPAGKRELTLTEFKTIESAKSSKDCGTTPVRTFRSEREEDRRRNSSVYQLNLGVTQVGGVNISSIPTYLMNPGITTLKREIKQEINTVIKTELRKEMEQIRIEIKGAIKDQIQKQLDKKRTKPQPRDKEEPKDQCPDKSLAFALPFATSLPQALPQKERLVKNLPGVVSKRLSRKEEEEEHFFEDEQLKPGRQKRLAQKLPELSPQKGRGAEGEERSVDLNDLMKKTLRWEAMKMKQLVKKYTNRRL